MRNKWQNKIQDVLRWLPFFCIQPMIRLLSHLKRTVNIRQPNKNISLKVLSALLCLAYPPPDWIQGYMYTLGR